jgi:hypothetical protein
MAVAEQILAEQIMTWQLLYGTKLIRKSCPSRKSCPPEKLLLSESGNGSCGVPQSGQTTPGTQA